MIWGEAPLFLEIPICETQDDGCVPPSEVGQAVAVEKVVWSQQFEISWGD